MVINYVQVNFRGRKKCTVIVYRELVVVEQLLEVSRGHRSQIGHKGHLKWAHINKEVTSSINSQRRCEIV